MADEAAPRLMPVAADRDKDDRRRCAAHCGFAVLGIMSTLLVYGILQILTDAALLKRQKLEIEELRKKLQGSHSEGLEQVVLKLRNDMHKEQMVAEKERELEEGEAQKSPSKIVADSLSQISRSSTFLPNIGVPTTSKTGRSTLLAAQARMQAQFEEKLQAEREEAARMQEELQAQLQAQQAALEENQSLLRQTQEEVKGMHTKFEKTNALLRAVLKLQKD
ncbi:hypothetical protein ZEAMMB73_Zm00001d029807 [Zea mays]|uniref:Uncharacterized protein n=1 Tax=Zea mays TaxID=4577 RepID=A0A1D6K7V7_MAIZE|nr:hypothetical protein ZEAMMB73_Zm00001d029807 [Zea mays]